MRAFSSITLQDEPPFPLHDLTQFPNHQVRYQAEGLWIWGAASDGLAKLFHCWDGGQVI